MRGFFRFCFIAFILLGCCTSTLRAQDDFFNQEYFRYEDHIYKPNIKTVQLYREGYELSSPILPLAGGDQLRLRFDDLKGDYKQYSFTFIHCDANWQPTTGLVKSEYMRGYFENQITNYEMSFNTIQQYTHYTVAFPNNDVQLTKSGNYLLVVYEDFDKENVILTRRFMLYEDEVSINARVKQATILDDRQTTHEVDFVVNHPGYRINNPFGEVTVVLRQNDRWDNAITNLKPMFVREDQLTYEYDYDNTFPAGNEFREFDIKSLRYYSEWISSISYDSLHNHVYLKSSEKRTFKRYMIDDDINGRYLIKTDDGNDSYTEADYAFVHFELFWDEVLTLGNVYVFGGLSDWQFKPNFMMRYNYKRKSYMLTAYLKQGFYNYEYVLLEGGKKAGDATYFEGSHWETEQNYSILVYHRTPGQYYDRLIGMTSVISNL